VGHPNNSGITDRIARSRKKASKSSKRIGSVEPASLGQCNWDRVSNSSSKCLGRAKAEEARIPSTAKLVY
jgi:hypothetical protein